MKLIIGLGNPERHYAGNRHNIGFMCLGHFAKSQGIGFDKKQGLARTGEGEVAGTKVVLARPQTHMNVSGDAVSRLMDKFHLELTDLVIVHDDLDLPLGKIRIRSGGSAGGHNGIKSIITRLGGRRDFIRIKVGIGRPDEEHRDAREEAIIAYVLSDFTRAEKEVITKTIPRVSEAILCLLTDGLEAAMNEYNRETLPPSSPSDHTTKN